ncbi:MAG: hypothetical protein JW927_05940 [Deltaproteobacteria bacterium]|nr:hypothetical protein [Deltaproteobacteria bacterium]
MKYSGRISKKIIFYILFCCIFLFCGCSFRPAKFIDTSLLPTEERVILNQKVFDKVWNLVNDKYYDPTFNGKDWVALGEKYRADALAAKDNKALYRTINKMLGELGGSHLRASMTGRFEDMYKDYVEPISTGFMWQAYEGKAVVTQVFPESLAEKAGVQRGWILDKIKGTPPIDGKLDTATNAPTFRVPILDIGKPESYIFIDQDEKERLITLSPEKEDKTLLRWTIDDKDIHYEPVLSRILPEGYLYLLLKNFVSFKVSGSIKTKINTEEGTQGLILDLRYNNGGMEFLLKSVLKRFFQDDINIGTRTFRSGKIREQKISGKKSGYTKPVVILIGENTFSAAEIFAHVMQHYQRGIVVGNKTKGYVQISRKYNLPGGGIINIPEINYTGLDGMLIEGRGVTPDIIVPEPDLATARAGRDLDLGAALIKLNAMNAGEKR